MKIYDMNYLYNEKIRKQKVKIISFKLRREAELKVLEDV